MPKELPGFYYDTEKNRYFPYKGPIPGSKPNKPKPVEPEPDSNESKLSTSSSIKQLKLIHTRELRGPNLGFEAQYLNSHVSKPIVWKYDRTEMMPNVAIHNVVAHVETPQGLLPMDLLFAGGGNGLVSLLEIVTRQEFGPRQYSYKPDCVWPHNIDHVNRYKRLVRQLGTSRSAMTRMPSEVTCIKPSKKFADDDTMSKHFFMTTLGSDSDPGTVYLVDMGQPIDFDESIPFYKLASYKQTLWTADSDPQGGHVVIGTNRGAALLNLETRVTSWVHRCKSDVFCVQLNQSGKVALCGLRNGGIVSVDTRQKHIKGSTNCSPTISMPSSVCCLASLNLCDQYFLASSMDGSIKLYDHRLIHRHGRAVQSYEGNVNSHTRLELGVDPSDKFIVSGGEDCYLRMWNIKSGELLFKDRFMNTPPSAVCWPRNKGVVASKKDGQDNRYDWEEDHMRGAWLGSAEGIYYMDWL